MVNDCNDRGIGQYLKAEARKGHISGAVAHRRGDDE